MTDWDYGVGDTLTYRTFGGDHRTVTVLHRFDDVKNGEPGFDACLRQHWSVGAKPSVWGYDRQIVEIIDRAVRL